METGLKIIISVFAFIFGAAFASFAGVVAYRAPKGKSVIKPDSYCPACGKTLSALDNIPVLAYVFLGGKCRYCKAKIGVFGFLCEIFGGLGFMLAFLMHCSAIPQMIILLCMVFLFLIIAGIDYETHDIYNITLIIYAVLSVALTAYLVLCKNGDILDHVFGAVMGFVFFGAVKLIAKFIMKKDALGSGDIFLVGIAGLHLGLFPLLLAILAATLTGSIIELTKIKLNKSEAAAEIAFGPYLLLGIGTLAIFGEVIMEFYWRLML